jgi:hypothetical protein
MRVLTRHHGLNSWLHSLLLFWTVLQCCGLATAQTSSKPGTRVNRDGLIVGEFQKRVSEYLKIRKQATGDAPAPRQTDAPEKIIQSQHELNQKIRELRPGAKQGDIFTPEVADLFRRLMTQSLTGADGRKIRKSYERAEPIHGVRLEVNQPYPDGLPLQSMPASVLMNLPKLPPELEYRAVGRELVLRDVAPNLVVDIIPDISLSKLPADKRSPR